MWFWFALGSAVFAALTSILAKIGIEGVNSNLATAIRTMVVVAMAWGMVFLTNTQGGIKSISQKSWVFLILSGLATGASWLCYYKALQIGEASKVVPIDKLSVVITLHTGAGLYLSARAVQHEISDRMHSDRRGNVGYGTVKIFSKKSDGNTTISYLLYFRLA